MVRRARNGYDEPPTEYVAQPEDPLIGPLSEAFEDAGCRDIRRHISGYPNTVR